MLWTVARFARLTFSGSSLRKQGRIAAGDREPRRAAPVRLRHAFIEPGRGGVEAGVRAVAKAKQRRFLVSKQRGDKRGARFISVLRDAARQRDRIQRGGHHQLLAGRESQSGADRDFGQAVEILFEFRCREELFFGNAVVEVMSTIIARGTAR